MRKIVSSSKIRLKSSRTFHSKAEIFQSPPHHLCFGVVLEKVDCIPNIYKPLWEVEDRVWLDDYLFIEWELSRGRAMYQMLRMLIFHVQWTVKILFSERNVLKLISLENSFPIYLLRCPINPWDKIKRSGSIFNLAKNKPITYSSLLTSGLSEQLGAPTVSVFFYFSLFKTTDKCKFFNVTSQVKLLNEAGSMLLRTI